MTAKPPSASDDRVDVWSTAAVQFAAWRDGETVAFDALVRLLTPVLWHVVRAYGLQRASAEDVLQEVWLTLARDPAQIRDAAGIGAWLLTTARRRAWRAATPGRDRLTRDGEIASVTAPPGAAPALEPGQAPGPVHADAPSAEHEALTALSRRRLWAAVGTLSERCRRLLRIVAFDDRPDYNRIATDLGMPVGSIGPTRRRCLDRLRSTLDEGAQP